MRIFFIFLLFFIGSFGYSENYQGVCDEGVCDIELEKPILNVHNLNEYKVFDKDIFDVPFTMYVKQDANFANKIVIATQEGIIKGIVFRKYEKDHKAKYKELSETVDKRLETMENHWGTPVSKNIFPISPAERNMIEIHFLGNNKIGLLGLTYSEDYTLITETYLTEELVKILNEGFLTGRHPRLFNDIFITFFLFAQEP